MRNSLLLVYLFGTIASSQEPQPLSPEQLHEMQVYLQQPNGDVVPIIQEHSAKDYEHEGTVPIATAFNTAEMLRLPGAKSALRVKEGDAVRLWAELPKAIGPRQLELLRFETRGKQRVTYLSRFGARSAEGHWNTVPFKARQNRAPKWLLEPTDRLPSGEYCLTPSSSTAHYCFGVDK